MSSEPLPMLIVTDFEVELTGPPRDGVAPAAMALHVCGDGATRVPEAVAAVQAQLSGDPAEAARQVEGDHAARHPVWREQRGEPLAHAWALRRSNAGHVLAEKGGDCFDRLRRLRDVWVPVEGNEGRHRGGRRAVEARVRYTT